jgi:hypothetical protein
MTGWLTTMTDDAGMPVDDADDADDDDDDADDA